MFDDWTSEDPADEGAEEGVEATVWAHDESDTTLRIGREHLSAHGEAPRAAVEAVRDAGVGENVPVRDAVLDLVDRTEGEIERWDALHPDHELVDPGEPAGMVGVRATAPGVKVGGFVTADGDIEEVAFGAAVSRTRTAEAAGLDTFALDRRVVEHEVDPEAVPATFGGVTEEGESEEAGARTVLGTVVYSLDGDDVLVTGDPTAVDDLDPGETDTLVVRAWPPAAVDREAVDDLATEVTVVEEADLDPDAVAERLGEELGDHLSLVDRAAAEIGEGSEADAETVGRAEADEEQPETETGRGPN